jgi:hypothetical protein
MTCPVCLKIKVGHFDKISIERRERCVDCHARWAERPENDPELKKFLIDYTSTEEDTVTIYAKSKDDAKEQFEEEYGTEYEMGWVREVDKETGKKV